MNTNVDVIIVGSGISGLCCGAMLSMEGKKVLILEKHFKLGGYTHTFKRKGFEWDVGIHYIAQFYKKYEDIHIHNYGYTSHHLIRAKKNGTKINYLPQKD